MQTDYLGRDQATFIEAFGSSRIQQVENSPSHESLVEAHTIKVVEASIGSADHLRKSAYSPS